MRALAGLAALLDPPGWVCLNLYGPSAALRGIRALRAFFHIEHEIHVGENLVLHGRYRTSHQTQLVASRPRAPRVDLRGGGV